MHEALAAGNIDVPAEACSMAADDAVACCLLLAVCCLLLLAFAAADADFCWQRKYLRERCGASFV